MQGLELRSKCLIVDSILEPKCSVRVQSVLLLNRAADEETQSESLLSEDLIVFLKKAFNLLVLRVLTITNTMKLIALCMMLMKCFTATCFDCFEMDAIAF